MKKLIPLKLLLLLLAFNVNAQSGMPPAYEIKTDTALSVILPDKYVQVLEDQGGKLTFDQVQQTQTEHEFHYTSVKKLEFLKHYYWFRYTLKNVMSHDASICFPVNGDQSVYYIKSESGRWRKYNNGDLTPRSEEGGWKLQRVIPIVIKVNQEAVIFNRIYNGNSFRISKDSIEVGFASSYAKAQQTAENDSFYIELTHDSVLFGIMFFAAILNFFFFLVARERVYLYFSIYLLISGINRMNVEFYYAFFREFRTLSVYIINFAHVFTFASLTIFIQSLLHTKVYLPRWDKFLTIFIIYSTVIGIAALLGLISWQPNSPFYARHVIIFSYVANVEIILLTFLLLLKIKKIERPVARLILPVQIIWGIGWPAYVLYLFFGYPLIGKVLSPLWANQWWYVIETVGLSWLAISFSWILLQRFRGMQKQIVQQALDREKEKNQLIAEQKIELERTVDERTSELKHSLTELQSTQSQLIQREKMASLGELTAGIAHEIQNPLNFVNNFSDVNREMITELEQELRTGNVEEALAIAADLKGNEEKISHHGKRADFIVKGMLQHSRSSGGEKQSTNMNVLCDEFLKLSYHGMRAKDKSFNAETVTNFGTGLPRINVSQQDIGRVMLNLINNAFYAVNEKATTSGPDYKPIVELSTAQSDGHIEIRVKDNGNGIPENIKDKIFQPFFTTKPTGEGTGLGLSLSYDIVVKEHGGKIDVESKQGEGSEFTVMLPAIS